MSRGRPKGSVKYKTEEQRKQARKCSAKRTVAPQIKSKYFRLVIPNLEEFVNNPEGLLKLKGDTLNLILNKQIPVGLQYYSIAVQTHPSTGVPHLDILLLYKQSRLTSLNRFDYLVKHGHLSKYRKLNQAILAYGRKQDSSPLSNLPSDVSLVLRAKQIQSDPYFVLSSQMKKDPFHFNAHEWLGRSGLDCAISKIGWSKHLSLLRHQQQALCNRLLHDRPGFQPITRELIESHLSAQELNVFDSWPGYQSIVDYLNQVPRCGFHRPHKSRQLLLVGRPNVGKTALAIEIRRCTSVYSFGVSNWFPSYRNDVYSMILWNQFNLKSMPYPQLLNVLEGQYTDLQYKGGSVLKTDNQLMYMTSNMSLQQHIRMRFRSEESRDLARANLRARIDEVVVPEGIDLFLLLKLIKSKL